MKRITDVRVRYQQTGELSVYIDGLLWGTSVNTTAARISAMLAVFNTGRRCYWDDQEKIFTTDPTMPASPQPEGPTAEGEVSSWEVRIPREGTLTITMNLLPDPPHPPPPPKKTAGEPAMGRTVLSLENDDVLPGIIAILISAYARFDGTLHNSDFGGWL